MPQQEDVKSLIFNLKIALLQKLNLFLNPLRGRRNIALRQIELLSSPNRLSNYISIILSQSTGFLEALNHISGFISSL